MTRPRDLDDAARRWGLDPQQCEVGPPVKMPGEPVPPKPRKPAALVAPSATLTVVLPVVVVSEANQRAGHWSIRRRRFGRQADAALGAIDALGLADIMPPGAPSAVTLVRLGGRRLDPDNLASSFKGLIDVLASWWSFNDGDPSITWHYAQEPGRGPAGVRVTVAWGAE